MFTAEARSFHWASERNVERGSPSHGGSTGSAIRFQYSALLKSLGSPHYVCPPPAPRPRGRFSADFDRRCLHLEVRVPARRGLEIHDDEPALAVALQQIERPDKVTLEDLAGLLVDERHGEGLLDGDHLRARVELLVEHGEHVRGEVEEALACLLLAEAERAVLALELPEGFEVALDIGDARPLALADAAEEERCGAVDPRAEGERRRHEVGLEAVQISEPVFER